MSYCYCTKCESVYRCEDVKCAVVIKNLIDWEEFAFIMGYPLYPVKKKYDWFHLDLYKRLDAKFIYDLREYSPELFIMSLMAGKRVN